MDVNHKNRPNAGTSAKHESPVSVVVISLMQVIMQTSHLSHRLFFIPRLHDTTGCQTG